MWYTIAMKTCSKCGLKQELTEFNRCTRNLDGRQNYCRSCCAKYTAANREKNSAYYKAYQVANHDTLAVKGRAYFTAHHVEILAKTRLSKYGLSPLAYAEMLRRQDYCCAICKKPFGETTPHVDHDHTTKRVRGLLCSHCNTGIGFLQEDTRILTEAIVYLLATK